MNALTTVKEKIENKKHLVPVLGGVTATLCSVVPVFAEGETPSTPSGNVTSGMTTALQTGFSNVQADVTTIISTALPYALVILGIGLALSIGIKMFTKISRKG